MILFNNVSKRYDNSDRLALDNVNFFIDKGEFVFIIGSSGAGKSTITKLIMREELPTSGNIIINNTDITLLPRKELPYYRRKLGIVFQDFRLIQSKNVYENVAFALQITGASAKEVRRRVPSVLNMVGLSHKAKAMPAHLSGGEQQRVALARAMVNNPPVLIADEPTGNLDPANSEEIIQILLDINMHGTTVLMVTHAEDIVNRMKKRVIEIQEGVIIRDQEHGSYMSNGFIKQNKIFR